MNLPGAHQIPRLRKLCWDMGMLGEQVSLFADLDCGRTEYIVRRPPAKSNSDWRRHEMGILGCFRYGGLIKRGSSQPTLPGLFECADPSELNRAVGLELGQHNTFFYWNRPVAAYVEEWVEESLIGTPRFHLNWCEELRRKVFQEGRELIVGRRTDHRFPLCKLARSADGLLEQVKNRRGRPRFVMAKHAPCPECLAASTLPDAFRDAETFTLTKYHLFYRTKAVTPPLS